MKTEVLETKVKSVRDGKIIQVFPAVEYEKEGKVYKTWYLLSSRLESASDTNQPETLVFPCDLKGNILGYMEIAGGRNKTHEQVLEEIKNL